MALWNRLNCVCPWEAEGPAAATTNCWWTISGGNSRGCTCSTTCTSRLAGSGRTCPLLGPLLRPCLLMLMDFPTPRCTSPALQLLSAPWSSEGPKLSCAGSKSPEPNLVDPLFLCNNIPRIPSCCQHMSLPFLPLAPPHPPSPTCTPTRLSSLAPPSVADLHNSLFRPRKTQREAYIKPWPWRDWGTGTWGTPWATLLLQRAMMQGSLASLTPTRWRTRPSRVKENQPTFTGLRYPSQPASMVTRCMEGQYLFFLSNPFSFSLNHHQCCTCNLKEGNFYTILCVWIRHCTGTITKRALMLSNFKLHSMFDGLFENKFNSTKRVQYKTRCNSSGRRWRCCSHSILTQSQFLVLRVLKSWLFFFVSVLFCGVSIMCSCQHHAGTQALIKHAFISHI